MNSLFYFGGLAILVLAFAVLVYVRDRRAKAVKPIVKPEHKYIYLKPCAGQKVYKLHVLSRTISEGKITGTHIGKAGRLSHRLIFEPGHLYTTAINLPNAKKQFNKQLTKLFMMHQKKAAV